MRAALPRRIGPTSGGRRAAVRPGRRWSRPAGPETTTPLGAAASTPQGKLCRREPGNGRAPRRLPGAGLGQLATRQPGGRGRRNSRRLRRAVGGWLFTPPPPRPLSLSARDRSAGPGRQEQNIYKSSPFIQSSLPKHARAVVERKQLLHFLKTKQKLTWCCPSLLPGRPRGRAGTGSKLLRSCLGRDSRVLGPPRLPERSKRNGPHRPPQMPCALSLPICNHQHTSRPQDRKGQTQSFICK